MPLASFEVGGTPIGGGSLTIVSGPCVIESEALCLEVGQLLRDTCARLGLGYVFKASFDKANRTSARSYRGPGLAEGLRILGRVKEALDVPVLTDIHLPAQAAPAAEAVDMLQIPAFLARQTDLLLAAAATGKAVNLKKAQFMAPGEVKEALDKLASGGCERVLVTERGTSFGYHNLIVDFRSLPLLRALGCPVCYDVTHSMQSPGGLGSSSGATREFAPHLARGAVGVGVDALFLEAHPDPANAKSDAAAQLPLAQVPPLLETLARLHQIVREASE